MTKVPEGVPRIIVNIDGRDYPLVYTVGVSMRLERETGRSTQEALERLSQGFVGDIGFLVWAMIAAEAPDLTPEQVGDKLTREKMDDLGAALFALIAESSAEEEGGAEGEAGARQTEAVGA